MKISFPLLFPAHMLTAWEGKVNKNSWCVCMHTKLIVAAIFPELIIAKAGLTQRQQQDQPYSKHTVDIIPNCPSKHWSIHIFMHGHCVVSQIVGNLKLLIYQLPHIWVETIYQWISMVFPWIVLKNKRWAYDCQLPRKKQRYLVQHTPILKNWIWHV